MRKTKQMANQIKEPADCWELEHYLTERRKEIDRKYDFRVSRLTRVFGTLLYDGRVTEEELHGLREDKIEAIRSCAKVLSEDAA
jgi:Photoprotection regulator fluorescence recovery protein